MMDNYFLDNNQKRLNVRSSDLSEIFESKTRKDILKEFTNGIKHSACQHCWDEEEAGKESKRLRDNKNYHAIGDSKTFKLFDLSLGNACNIKCRTCGPYNSSQWAKEYKDLDFFEGSKEDFKTWLKGFNDAFEDNSNFWRNFQENLPNIVHIDFYGGEPFLVKKQWEMLHVAIQSGYAKNISVHYNTNGTIWNNKIYSVLKEFREVYIDFSIDGVKDKLYYIRHPAEWNTVFANFKKVQDIANNSTNFFLSVCNTISILNVYYIDEIYETFAPYTDRIYLNLVFGPEHYCITNIPTPIKNKIKEKLDKIEEHNWIPGIVNFMMSKKCNENCWHDFVKYTKMHDSYRKENFSNIFPELTQIIRDHGYSI
jgi:sulfatase maturation enzyme AslB (radical SAM superfamily)